MIGQLVFAGHHHRGACAGLSTFACPEHPCRFETPANPVRTGGLLVRSPSRPRIALQRSSVAMARCLEFASTTDVHVTSTRRKHPFWRLPVERRGKPADVPLRDRSRLPGFRLALNGAGPPCGHPTSNGHTLDGVSCRLRACRRPRLRVASQVHVPRCPWARSSRRCVRPLRGEGKLLGVVCPRCLCQLDPLTPLTGD